MEVYILIKRIVTATPRENRLVEARQWVQELFVYIKKKWPQFSPQVFIEKNGEFNRLYMMNQYESIGDLENALVETRADEWFRIHYRKGKKLFIEGSRKIILLESL
jgi:hypothetical protein